MNVEAWYFLYGTTNGVCNLTYFLSLLSGMAVTEVSKTKRGLGYVLHPGQVDGSMLSLAKEWNIGRKSVSRLLEDFSQRGCVKSWMMDGRLTENPTYQQTVKAYEGVRIYLFNGQRLELLRKSSAARKKRPKDKAEIAVSHAELPNRTEPMERPVLEGKRLMAEPGNPTESPAVPPQTNTNGGMVQPEDSPPTMPSERTLFDGNPSYI